MGIANIAKNSARIVQNVDKLVEESIMQVEQPLVDLNRAQLLSHKRADGAKITPQYSKGYAAFKGFKNPNLKLTGDFQKDMYLKTNGSEFDISSIDGKTLKLITKYSDKIFGISKKDSPTAKKLTVEQFRIKYFKQLLNG